MANGIDTQAGSMPGSENRNPSPSGNNGEGLGPEQSAVLNTGQVNNSTMFDRYSQLCTAGYSPALLPIIPVGATLGTQSNLKPHNLGKIPGQCLHSESNTWVGLPGWQAKVTAETDIQRFANWPEHPVCCLSASFPGVDVDVDDPAIVAEVCSLLSTVLPATAVRTREGSPRVIWSYRLAEGEQPMDKAVVLLPDGKGKVEFLGDGQQYLLLGNHKSGAKQTLTGHPVSITPAQVQRAQELLVTSMGGELTNAKKRMERSSAGAVPLEHDDIALTLQRSGELGTLFADGSYGVQCPGLELHTSATDERDTTYLPGAGFSCLHESCGSPTTGEYCSWVTGEAHPDEYAFVAFGPPRVLPEEVQHVAIVPLTRFTDAMVDSHKSGRNIAMGFARQDCIQSKHLITYQGVVYEYKYGAYKSTEKDWLIHQITNFAPHCFSVDEEGKTRWAEPTRALVNNAMGVVHAASHDARFDEALPLWRSDHEGYPDDTSNLIIFKNGMLDIKTKLFYPSTPALFTLNPLPFDYEPDAPIPERFYQFLNEVWTLLPGELIKPEHLLLQEILGYILSGETSMQKIFLLIGIRRSGKGTIGRLMKTLVGQNAFCGASLRASSSHFGLEGLIDKRLWLVADARVGKNDDQAAIVERLLNISGEDPVSVPRKYIGDWVGIISARTVVLSNSIPKLYEPSGAMESRLIPLRFTNSFEGREDRDLDAKLQAEISGIINWALLGLDRLMSKGQFTVTNDVLEMKEDFRELANPMADFVGSVVIEDLNGRESTTEVFQVWNEYRLLHRIPLADNPRSFGHLLREILPSVRKKRKILLNGKICDVYLGVRIVDKNPRVEKNW